MKAEERNSQQWAEYYENLERKNYTELNNYTV